MKANDEILVNMPDCTNLKITFLNGEVQKVKRISEKDAINTLFFYNLTEDVQRKINNFTCPQCL